MNHTPQQLAVWRRMERIRLYLEAARAHRVALARQKAAGAR